MPTVCALPQDQYAINRSINQQNADNEYIRISEMKMLINATGIETNYPAFLIDNQRISLIYPYTIDEQLIVEANISLQVSSNHLKLSIRSITGDVSDFIIKSNQTNFILEALRSERERLNLYNNYSMSNFFTTELNVLERDARLSTNGIHLIFKNIIDQSIYLHSGNYQEFNNGSLMHLQRQLTRSTRRCRVALYNNQGICDNYIMRNTENGFTAEAHSSLVQLIGASHNYMIPEPQDFSFSTQLTPYQTRVVDSINGIGIHTSNSLTSQTIQQKKYIHNNDFKPEYIKHKTPEESNDLLYLGVELEVDNGGENNDIAKICLKIINDGNDKEDLIYCMRDGSLKDGFEITTMPCTFEYHKQLKYNELFNFLNNTGYKSHDTETCGMHVHINRDFFGISELKQQLAISKILYIVEKFNDEISIIGRRNCKFSQYLGYTKETPVDLFIKSHNINNKKYAAINLQHDDSIEFRMFKGTLKYSTFINTIEFVSIIANFAKNTPIEEIEFCQWSDIVSTFSAELLEYYESMKKKVSNDVMDDMKKNQRSFLSRWENNVNNVIDGSFFTPVRSRGMSMCMQQQLRYPLLNTIPDSHEIQRGVQHVMNNMTSEEIQNLLHNSTFVTSELLPDEKIKREISELKRKIKYEQNYLLKSKLNKQLTLKNIELAKLIKQNRQNNQVQTS